MNTYKWEKINYPSEKDDWKIKTTKQLPLMFCMLKEKKIYVAYVPKQLKL